MKTAKPLAAFGSGFIAVAVFCLFSAKAVFADVTAGAPESPPESRTERQLEGWTVRVDDRLLQPPNVEFGQRVLKFLEAKLSDITYVVSPEPLAQLRMVPIVLDLSHGQLRTMQYHPNAGWLAEHGYATNLGKCVHIPRAADLVTARNVNEQPWVILHELAHAYHDQVLGFDDPRILQAYERYRQSGHGDATRLFDGSRGRHYALTDHKEFFAEMTEAYFGENDFFPFNRAELMTAEPEIYALLQTIWGPVAGRLDKPPKPGKTSNIQKTSPEETATVLWPDQPVPGDVSGAYYDWQITKQPERQYLHPYHQTLVMKIFLAEKQPNEGCKVYLTFEQALAVIQRLDHITLGIPKIVYLVGWQHNGHDSKYPDWSVVNPRLKRAQDASALASLKWLMAEGFKYHTTVSLHINMFDAYADSPLWETYLTNDIIAKGKDGEPLPGEVMGSTPEELKHPRIERKS